MNARGFTLVELLAAMAVGSLLLVSLSVATGSLGRETRSAVAHRDLAIVQAVGPMLTTLIESGQPPTAPRFAFIGVDRKLSLVVPPPAALGPIGPVRLTLDVEPGAKGEALRAAFSSDGEFGPLPGGAEQPVLLAEGFRSIRFSYEDEGRVAKERLPRLIVITFTSEDGAVRSLVAEPRINSDGACRYDPISMTCRP